MNTPSSACPDIGAWRAWLDHEGETPQVEAHLATCPGCRRLVADLREDAAVARDAFAMLNPGPTRVPSAADVAGARERLQWQGRRRILVSALEHSQEPMPMFLSRVSTAWRLAASGVAAALALSLLVSLTPEGRAVASGLLAQFRSQQVTAVEVTPQTQNEIIKTLNALGNLGTVKTANGIAGRPEAAVRGATEQAKTVSLVEASQTVGFTLETPDPATLPAGLDKTPRVTVMPASQLRFTFDKTKAATYYKSSGHPAVTLPDKFDGATLVVSIPAAALLEYGSSGGGARDALIVGQAGEMVIDVEGKVNLDEMRDFLLALPGLPQTVVNQLRQIKTWNQTLPIPVPVDQVNWQSTTFQGKQGLLLNDNSGAGSAGIWYDNGHIYGVAGSIKATDLKRIAESLAVR